MVFLIPLNAAKFKVERFFASSSSVYGENNNFPLSEKKKYTQKIFMRYLKKIMKK